MAPWARPPWHLHGPRCSSPWSATLGKRKRLAAALISLYIMLKRVPRVFVDNLGSSKIRARSPYLVCASTRVLLFCLCSFLATEHFRMQPTWLRVTESSELVFLVIFMLEVAVKWLVCCTSAPILMSLVNRTLDCCMSSQFCYFPVFKCATHYPVDNLIVSLTLVCN